MVYPTRLHRKSYRYRNRTIHNPNPKDRTIMKWLKNMSTKELAESYEKVTNEEDLQEFENHCQEIGIRMHNATKDAKEWGLNRTETIMEDVLRNDDVREAVKALVNHSLKMMDK